MGETVKARERRKREGWFERFAPPAEAGIDIGCGNDPLNESFRRWDKGDGDATYMASVPDDMFRTVYASHVLEHLDDPIAALRNWYRITAPNGRLIVCVPHRDLYEKKKCLPSRWNPEHKTFWLPDRSEPPCTWSLRDVVEAALPCAEICLLRVLDDEFHDPGADEHSQGEYSIEVVLRKPAACVVAPQVPEIRRSAGAAAHHQQVLVVG